MRLHILLSACLFVMSNLVAQVTFSDEVISDGLFSGDKNCIVDMNGDQLDDIVTVISGKVTIFYQQADGSFVSKVIRTTPTASTLWSICAADIDGNGFNDIALGYQEYVSFLYADINGGFYSVDQKQDPVFSQRISFADINNDGHLDAFVCHDESQNLPYRNDGTGHLILDIDLLYTPESLAGNYTSTFVDYDNDGDLDMHMAKCIVWAMPGHEGRDNLLYNNDGNNNYTEVGAGTNMEDNDQSWVSLWEDFDQDGDFDVITFNHEVSNRFMDNQGDGTFVDVSNTTGIPTTALGVREALAADFDNDGHIDILTDNPPNFFYGNGDNTFVAYPSSVPAGAIGDLNDDGFIDVVYRNKVWYNNGNTNHWIRINTIGNQSNRNGIGARVELYGAWGRQTREVRASQSWSTMNTLATHFGIGSATAVDSIVVKWPSGMRSLLVNPPIDQAIVVEESGCPFTTVGITNSGDNYLCLGESRTLTAPSGYNSYAWSDGSQGTSVLVTAAGSYNVTVTDASGCEFISEIIVISGEEQEFSIFSPQGTLFCAGTSLYLEVDTDQDVIWSNGRTEKFIYVFEEGIYSAEVLSDCNQTTSSVSIEVSELVVPPLPIEDFYYIDTSELNNVISIDDGRIVLWWANEFGGTETEFNGNDFFVGDIVSDTTLYVSTFSTLPNGTECYSERFPVNILISPLSTNQILVDGDTFICEDETTTLSAPAGYTYLWTTGEVTQSITVSDSDSYVVTITDDNGGVEVLDAIEISQFVVEAPLVEDVTVAAGTTSVLLGTENQFLLWWDAPSGGNLIHVGDSWLHTNIMGDFTYYLEAERELPNGKICTSERVPLTVFVASGISELALLRNIKVYPNPSAGQFTISMDDISDLEQIMLTDIYGRKVFDQRSSFAKQTAVDLTNVNPGLYLMKIKIGSELYTEKVIVE